MRAAGTKCCSVALIIRPGSPLHSLKPENKESFPSYSLILLLESLRFCTRNRPIEYLIIKGESVGILSLKDHLLIWAGFLCFTKFKNDVQMLATVPPAPSKFLRNTLFPMGLLLFALLLPGQTAQTDLCFIPRI